MDVKICAHHLRNRLRSKQLVPAEIVDNVPDEEVIKSYFSRSNCEGEEISWGLLATIINEFDSIDEVCDTVDSIHRAYEILLGGRK